MADALLSTLLAEPAVPEPPRRVWRDWLLVGLFVPAAVVEGIVRDAVPWRPGATIAMAAAILTLLWRRTHPLAMLVVAFSGVIGLDLLSRAFGNPPIEFFSSAFVLILPYALFRWASGRHAAIGLGVMLAALVSGLATNWTGLGDAIGGSIVFLFPAVLGAEVRHLVASRTRDREEVKTREREMLARELHDTVAHHVSAIAVRAQAGQVVGAKRCGRRVGRTRRDRTRGVTHAGGDARHRRLAARLRTMPPSLRSPASPTSGGSPTTATCRTSTCTSTTTSTMSVRRSARRSTGSHRRP